MEHLRSSYLWTTDQSSLDTVDVVVGEIFRQTVTKIFDVKDQNLFLVSGNRDMRQMTLNQNSLSLL